MESTAKLDRLRVMIVEDSAHMTLIVKTILRGFGVMDIIETRTPDEAWERLTSEAIDIIVLDRILGPKDGLDFVRRARDAKTSPNPYVPIIMLSGRSLRSQVAEARDAGVTEFCGKPVTVRDMYNKLASVIDRPRSFVRTKQFFGPDRRRHSPASYDGEKRREDDGQSADAA